MANTRGRTGAEIRAERPDWQLFRDGCPGGESPQQVTARADRMVRGLRAVHGDVLVFQADILFVSWPRAGSASNPRFMPGPSC